MRYLPMNYIAGTELVPLFKQMLELCRLKPGERVLVYSDSQSRPNYVAAAVGAAMELGADVANLTIPSVNPVAQMFAALVPDFEKSLVAQAWCAADLVIDVIGGVGGGYSQVLNIALPKGTRVFRAVEPVEVLTRLFPTKKGKARCLASREILRPARRLRMVSDAGTDVVFDKTGRDAFPNYGYADEPGHWDYWSSLQIVTAPLEDKTEGVVVVNVGDAIIPLARHVSSPFRLIIKGGRLVEIEGDGLDAFLLREFFASYNDPNAYVISHIGWGLQDQANWNRMGQRFMEAGGLTDCEGFWGDVQIAFGMNANYQLAGKNFSRAHCDIPCRNTSFYVDDRLMVDHGQIVAEEIVNPDMSLAG